MPMKKYMGRQNVGLQLPSLTNTYSYALPLLQGGFTRERKGGKSQVHTKLALTIFNQPLRTPKAEPNGEGRATCPSGPLLQKALCKIS